MGKSQSKKLTSILEDEKSNYIRFALVGSSGSGMSAFVNAVRWYSQVLIFTGKFLACQCIHELSVNSHGSFKRDELARLKG
jgi:ABC-type lipoprotein export system ATPase subunit